MAIARRPQHADWDNLKEYFVLYRNGRSDAIEVLFSELLRVLTAFFLVRMSSATEAEDMVQATLLKIHFYRDRYNSDMSLKTWVFTIASRTLIDHWRGLGSETESMADQSHDEQKERSASHASLFESLPSELIDPARKTELSHDLNLALKKLKSIDRTIVYLYGVEGMSMAEIAQVLSISEGAVKVRAHRAYKEVGQILGALVLLWISWEQVWMR